MGSEVVIRLGCAHRSKTPSSEYKENRNLDNTFNNR